MPQVHTLFVFIPIWGLFWTLFRIFLGSERINLTGWSRHDTDTPARRFSFRHDTIRIDTDHIWHGTTPTYFDTDQLRHATTRISIDTDQIRHGMTRTLFDKIRMNRKTCEKIHPPSANAPICPSYNGQIRTKYVGRILATGRLQTVGVTASTVYKIIKRLKSLNLLLRSV